MIVRRIHPHHPTGVSGEPAATSDRRAELEHFASDRSRNDDGIAAHAVAAREQRTARGQFAPALEQPPQVVLVEERLVRERDDDRLEPLRTRAQAGVDRSLLLAAVLAPGGRT